MGILGLLNGSSPAKLHFRRDAGQEKVHLAGDIGVDCEQVATRNFDHTAKHRGFGPLQDRVTHGPSPLDLFS